MGYLLIIPVLDTGQMQPGPMWIWPGAAHMGSLRHGGLQTSHQPLPRLSCASPASGHWYIKDPRPLKVQAHHLLGYPAA